MDDLISRAWVLAEYDRQHKGPPGGARKIMENAPAVDAAPVVHGEWKWSHGGQCSECGFHNSNFDYKYCPECGRKVKKDD